MTNSMAESEWAVMRVLWTLNVATSNELTTIMAEKKDWSSSTTKTIIRRLQSKGFITDNGEVRKREYSPLVTEDDTMTEHFTNLMDDMCAMKVGGTLSNALANITLSKNDINQLIEVLNSKEATAPEMVECDCLPVGCKLHLHKGDNQNE
jgi:CopY/TcrY family copper transport repressor